MLVYLTRTLSLIQSWNFTANSIRSCEVDVLLALITLLGIFSTTADIRAATYHVASTNNANDSNLGISINSPWATIGKANISLQVGDTVYLHGGTYSHQIRPVNNGTGETTRISYIAAGDGIVILDTFGDTNGGNSPTIGAIALGGKSYVTVDGVNQLIRVNKSGCYNALANITGAFRTVINSVYLDGSNNTCSSNYVLIAGYLYGTNAGATHYNLVSNSYIRGISATPFPYTEDTVSMAGDAHHNLFDGNTIEYAAHVNLNLGKDASGLLPHDNMIRNNTFNNPLHTNLQFFQGGPNDNMAEGNRLAAGGGAPTSPNGQGPGVVMEMSGARGIFRYNVIQKGGTTTNTNRLYGGFYLSIGGTGSLTSIANNRVYNNTIVKNSGVAVSINDSTGNQLNNTQNKFVNNIMYDSNAPIDPPLKALILYQNDTNDVTGDRFWSNILGSPGGSNTDNVVFGDKWGGYKNLATAAGLSCATYPCMAQQYAKPNIMLPTTTAPIYTTPDFINYAAGDYRLGAGSVAIDSGSELTRVTTTMTGLGTTLVVDDAYFFQNGRGIPGVQADWIAVGTVNNVAQISTIDYSTKTITLASAIDGRTAGAKVWLYKKSDGQLVLLGTGSDIGAFEYAPTASTPVANFTCTPITGRKPLSNVVCTDSSTNAPISWAWTFGDGGTNNVQNPPARTYSNAGTYTVALSATNASGSNTLTRTGYITVSQTLFTTQVPANLNQTDNTTYELGMKFKSARAGKITHIRYWKATSESGTHVGRIWNSSGTQLAIVTFTGETASGWQEKALATPLSISANTTYMVSVNVNTHFVLRIETSTPSLINGDLSTLFDNFNGAVGSSGTFPTFASGTTNYFRDVVFLPN
jgi:PKD repeat protein